MNWSSAQRYCRENFRDLATVTNATQNQEIQNMFSAGRWPWIGLFRDPHVNWSDGSGSSFRHWSTDYISDGMISVMCGVSALQSSGQWMLRSCDTKLPFVCYSVPPPPVKRQVVKVRIDSSVDLNDPAVQADILKKFEDRLKEKGVSGVTLKWRKQPDGKVFHKEEETSQKKKRKNTEL
ncbi:snaclec echicetin subunit beta-like [Symphorus nematophorus]